MYVRLSITLGRWLWVRILSNPKIFSLFGVIIESLILKKLRRYNREMSEGKKDRTTNKHEQTMDIKKIICEILYEQNTVSLVDCH